MRKIVTMCPAKTVQQIAFRFPATDDEIDQAIKAAMRTEARRLGSTSQTGPYFWWVWLIFLPPSALTCQSMITTEDFRRVVREKYQGWRMRAVAVGWQPTEKMDKDRWWE